MGCRGKNLLIWGFQKLPVIQEWQYCHLCFSCAIWNLMGHQNFLAWNIILLYLVIYNFAFTKTIWLELSRKLQMCGNTQMVILLILPLLPMLLICWKPRLGNYPVVSIISCKLCSILTSSDTSINVVTLRLTCWCEGMNLLQQCKYTIHRSINFNKHSTILFLTVHSLNNTNWEIDTKHTGNKIPVLLW